MPTSPRPGPRIAAAVLLGIALTASATNAPTARAAALPSAVGVIGWDGDQDAPFAYNDGSFHIRAGKNITAGFGIYNNPGNLQWYNAGGYYPALVTQFERDNTTVKITDFADQVTIGGNSYEAVYSRVTVTNHDTLSHTEDPAPSAGLLPLNSVSNTVSAGQTANHDYVVATDRFGNSYPWPADSALIAAGGFDAHYGHMTSYWDAKLARIATLDVPDPRLANAFKAGYIYTNIVKDGGNLNVGENNYDRLFDHDLIGILTNLLTQGDLADAHTYLKTLITNEYPDATYKFSWPWAVYLEKSGDKAFVQANFAQIQGNAHAIAADATGPGGTMMASNAVDTMGHWTVDDQSALLGLLAYGYIAQKLANTTEATWAANEYKTLFSAVNTQLQKTISTNQLGYVPCAIDLPNTADRCSNTNDANWASSLLFGRWNWDGYLFGAAQTGPMAALLDATYDYGFAHLAGLPAHTYGGYTGYSTGYNAGYGEAGLASANHRSEGVYDYEFMINNTQSAPFSWWEGIPSAGPTAWTPGGHATAGTGSSPHMWGQANTSKVLLDSVIAETADARVIVGRGIPNEWLRAGQTISATNYPIANGNRMGATIATGGKTVTLTLSGATPTGGVVFNIPAFAGNIASATAGAVDSANGTVTLPPGVTATTVSLVNAPTYRQLGGLDLNSYCRSVGDTGGVSLDGTTANDWHCVTPTANHVSLDMDDACAWQYRFNEAAFSQYTAATDPYSWKCYSS
jgi:hypothetical protein